MASATSLWCTARWCFFDRTVPRQGLRNRVCRVVLPVTLRNRPLENGPDPLLDAPRRLPLVAPDRQQAAHQVRRGHLVNRFATNPWICVPPQTGSPYLRRPRSALPVRLMEEDTFSAASANVGTPPVRGSIPFRMEQSETVGNSRLAFAGVVAGVGRTPWLTRRIGCPSSGLDERVEHGARKHVAGVIGRAGMSLGALDFLCRGAETRVGK